VLDVFCLCAAWCRNCDDYRPTFDTAAAELGAQACFRWVDIEDQAALVGDIDVVDFPTLLVASDGRPVFLGPLTPQPAVLMRVLRSALAGALPPLADAEAAAFLTRAAAGPVG
jgi:thioredoxin-like negative regulator of GroEL